MRVSTDQMFRTGTEAMQLAQSALNKTQLQLSTGKRILTPADDPSGATQSAQFRSIIDSIDQYQRNTDLLQPRLEQEEWAIAGVIDQLQRVRELVLAGANDSQTSETRSYMADEIQSIRNSIYDIANTKDPNGEYLFGGTESLAAPFRQNLNGVVSYTGADGEGSVREIAISASRQIAIGNNGADVFMNNLENDGRIAAAITRGTGARGSLVIERDEITNLDQFLTGTNATDEFGISFQKTSTGQLQYRVDNLTQGSVETGWTDYTSGGTIEFAGRGLVLSGTPSAPDEVLPPLPPPANPNPASDLVTSRPARNVSLFSTLDAIITAFDTPVGGDSSRADLTNAVNRGLENLDSSFNHLNDIRATVGTRLQVLEEQSDLNAGRKLDLQSTLSEIEDLDYAEAISRFSFQQVALEAAQQSYVQTNRLSLFNFL